MNEDDKVTLLLLESDPDNTIEVEELDREIKQAIQSSRYRDQIQANSRIGIRGDRLLDDLNEGRPELLLISGKTEGESFCYPKSWDGTEVVINPETMTRVLHACDGIRLVLFAGNNTAKLAQTAVGAVGSLDFALGIQGNIEAKQLRTFAAHFFSALLYGLSVAKAFEQGKLSIDMIDENSRKKELVSLCCRTGLDPASQFFFHQENMAEKKPYIKHDVVRTLSDVPVDRSSAELSEITAIRDQAFSEEGRRCLIIGGMAGSGKSELARYLAQNHGRRKKLEYYLDDSISGSREKQLEGLIRLTHFGGFANGYEKTEMSLPWKKQLMIDFLQEETPLLILHGVERKHKSLLDLLTAEGAFLLVTTRESSSALKGYPYLDLDELNKKDEEFLISLFSAYYSDFEDDQNWLKENYAEKIRQLILDKLQKNLTMIITFARLLKQFDTEEFEEMLDDLLTCDLESMMKTDGLTVSSERDGSSSEREPYEILKRLFLQSVPEKLSEDEKQVLRLLMLAPEAWLEQHEVKTLLGDSKIRSTRILKALQKLEACHMILRKKQFRRKKNKKSVMQLSREQLSLTPLLASAIRLSEEGERLYVEEPTPSFFNLISKNGVYLGKYQNQLKEQLVRKEKEDFRGVTAALVQASKTGVFDPGAGLFPYDTLFKYGNTEINTMDAKKIRKYFPYACCFVMVESKKQIDIYVKPLNQDRKDFCLASWDLDNRYTSEVKSLSGKRRCDVTNVRLMAWFYAGKETNVDLKELTFPDEAAGYPITATSIRFSKDVNRNNWEGGICLPKTLQVLGADSFGGLPVTEVRIGSALCEIQGQAFKNCTRLSCVTYMEDGTDAKLTSIGRSAFENCCSLSSLELREGLKEIRELCFKGCTALSTVICPDSLERVGKLAFSDCEALETLSIPDHALMGRRALQGTTKKLRIEKRKN